MNDAGRFGTWQTNCRCGPEGTFSLRPGVIQTIVRHCFNRSTGHRFSIVLNRTLWKTSQSNRIRSWQCHWSACKKSVHNPSRSLWSAANGFSCVGLPAMHARLKTRHERRLQEYSEVCRLDGAAMKSRRKVHARPTGILVRIRAHLSLKQREDLLALLRGHIRVLQAA